MSIPMERLFGDFNSTTLKEWKEIILTDLKGDEYESLIWEDPENIQIEPIYNPESIPELRNDITHQHSNWEIEQTLVLPKNKKILASLNSGATALLIKDLPSKDIETVFEGVWIQHIQTSFQSKTPVSDIEAFVSLVQKRKLDKNTIRGSLQYDPLMDGLRNGELQTNLWENFKSIQENVKELPQYKSVCLRGYEYHNAGATLTQELAFTLAQLSEYFANTNELKPDKIQVSLAVSTNYFFEIAKFRAIRILWKQILKAYNKKYIDLDLRAESSSRTSTLYEPQVNMLRNTSQCMSAALGGANTINVNSFNTVYLKEDDFGQRMARNISLILKEESYFNKVVDPSAGSYYIEYLTNKLSENAWKVFQNIEKKGGWLTCVKMNTIQEMIEKNARSQEHDLNNKKIRLLGTNLFPNREEKMSHNIDKSLTLNLLKGKEFKAMNANRLSANMDLERLAKEPNDV